MTEIDLIPIEYRDRCQVWSLCRRFSIALATVLVLTVGLTVIVNQLSISVKKDVVSLQEEQKVSTQHSENLQNLRSRAKNLTEELTFLNGLSGGLAAEKVFQSMDQALVGVDVWFLNWEFSQVGSAVNTGKELLNNRNLLVVPSGTGGDTGEAWKIDTQMAIKGRAADHVALSLFARQLLKQPDIRDVRVLNTRLTEYAGKDTIEFDLVVTIKLPEGES